MGKLRLLLRKKAAEELKKEQERKAAERRKVIDERGGQPKDLDSASEDDLQLICQDYFDRMYECESQKYDMEFECRKKDFEINELNIAVNDLRGKFIKPTLKKVSKYENKFAKLQKPAQDCQEEGVHHGRGGGSSGRGRRSCRSCCIGVMKTQCTPLTGWTSPGCPQPTSPAP